MDTTPSSPTLAKKKALHARQQAVVAAARREQEAKSKPAKKQQRPGKTQTLDDKVADAIFKYFPYLSVQERATPDKEGKCIEERIREQKASGKRMSPEFVKYLQETYMFGNNPTSVLLERPEEVPMLPQQR